MTHPEPAPGAPTEPPAAPGAPTPAPTPTALADRLAQLAQSAPESAPTVPAPGPSPDEEPVDVSSLPPNVKRMISQLRNEAKNARIDNKNARAELLAQLGQALGLQEAPPDPTALASQLEATQSDAAAAVLELDVYKVAIGAGANPVKLLDSVAFREAVDALEADGFDDGLKALIAARLESDPSLRLGGAPTAAPSGRQPVAALRPGALPGAAVEPSIDDQITDAQKAGNAREVIRLNGIKMQQLAANNRR